MNANEKLARFALRHIAKSNVEERPELLDAAAEHLPVGEGDMLRTTAAFMRQSEQHQLKIFAVYGEASP